MSIGITVSVRVSAGLSFDMEPGDVLTADVIQDYIDSMNRHFDRVLADAGDCQMYVIIEGVEANAPIDAYNRESGAIFNPVLDQPIGEA